MPEGLSGRLLFSLSSLFLASLLMSRYIQYSSINVSNHYPMNNLRAEYNFEFEHIPNSTQKTKNSIILSSGVNKNL